jgi:hypothetical protein
MDDTLPRDDNFDDALSAQFEDVEPDIDPSTDVETPDGNDVDLDAPDPAEPTVEPASETITFGDKSYNVDDVRGVINWVENLTPEQMARMQDALYERSVQQADPQPAVDQPQGYTLDPDETLDPRLAQYVEQRFGQVEEYLRHLTAATWEQRQIEASRQETQLVEALHEARTGVAERLGLDDADLAALTTATEQAGIVAFLSQRDGMSNPRAVFEEALETVYWSTPEFRQRAMTVTAEAAAEEAASLAQKKARAGSLSSKGATAPRSKSSVPMSSDEAFAAMVNELAKDLSEN